MSDGSEPGGGDSRDEAPEAQQYIELAQRIQAEFSNYKKNVAGRTKDEVDLALGRLVADFLPVLDALEAAETGGVPGAGEIRRMAADMLGRYGLERLHVLGAEFDPSVAEAVVALVGTEVAVEHRGGYLWRGKLLRAALVEVGTSQGDAAAE